MLLENFVSCGQGKIKKQMEENGMDADRVIECIKFCKQCEREGFTFKEILDQITKKPEDKTKDRKDEVEKELDEAIISICKEIKYIEARCGSKTNPELVKALADLVEVRSCMPDWKYRYR